SPECFARRIMLDWISCASAPVALAEAMTRGPFVDQAKRTVANDFLLEFRKLTEVVNGLDVRGTDPEFLPALSVIRHLLVSLPHQLHDPLALVLQEFLGAPTLGAPKSLEFFVHQRWASPPVL